MSVLTAAALKVFVIPVPFWPVVVLLLRLWPFELALLRTPPMLMLPADMALTVVLLACLLTCPMPAPLAPF